MKRPTRIFSLLLLAAPAMLGAQAKASNDFKQHRSNTVVRWEDRPGSTLYLAWAQERTIDVQDPTLARLAALGLGELKAAHPGNVFLIKGSYWFSM